jgi:hypothetical protein
MKLQEEIEDLKLKLESETLVKQNEVLINASYKETILKLEDQIETLVKLNEKLFEDKAKLKHIISVLSGK